MSVSIVVPVLNESGNVSNLYEGLERELSHDFEVIFVDGGSSDGTVEELRALESHCEEVHTLVREDMDLAGSVLTGFKHATWNRAVVMDGDMQHPTHRVSELVEKLEDSELVIGTGVSYSSVEGKLSSLFRNIYSKIWITDARGLSDPTSGFYSVNLDKVNIDRLSPKSSSILLELLADIETGVEETKYNVQKEASRFDLSDSIRTLIHAPDLKLRKNRYWS